jgi:hypothetical protein
MKNANQLCVLNIPKQNDKNIIKLSTYRIREFHVTVPETN